LAANSAWAKLAYFMIVPGRFDYREFSFAKSETQAGLISVSLSLKIMILQYHTSTFFCDHHHRGMDIS